MPRRTRPRNRRSRTRNPTVPTPSDPRPLTTEQMAIALVKAGKASPQILSHPHRFTQKETPE